MGKNNEISQIYSYVIEQYKKDKNSTAYGELRIKKPLTDFQSKYTDIQRRALEDGKTYTKVVYRMRNGKRKKYIEVRRRGYGTIKRVKYTHQKYEELTTDEQTTKAHEHLSDTEIKQLLVRTLRKQSTTAYDYWLDFEQNIGVAKGVIKSVNKGTETGDEHFISVYIDYAGAWRYDETFNL